MLTIAANGKKVAVCDGAEVRSRGKGRIELVFNTVNNKTPNERPMWLEVVETPEGLAVVESDFHAGKIVKLEVIPESRKKDVVIFKRDLDSMLSRDWSGCRALC